MRKNRVFHFLLPVLALSLLLNGCVRAVPEIKGGDNATRSTETTEMSEMTETTGIAAAAAANNKELRAVWLTCYEAGTLFAGKSAAEAQTAAQEAAAKIKDFGLNTVFFQVRAFSDALYRSALFPTSKLLLDEEGAEPEFDAFAVFLEAAHAQGLAVHAWVNPFRISKDTKLSELPADHPARKLQEEAGDETVVLQNNKGLYWNPASATARGRILGGIRELLENYPLDGIHFDDYFYPAASPMGDEAQFAAYRTLGGVLSIGDWRREQVSALVASVYAAIKSCDAALLFGISPAADVKDNREKAFADVAAWCGEEGYVDYMLPQLYFGFMNETKPFLSVKTAWEQLPRAAGVKLYVGIAAYKAGREDAFAGSGSEEWQSDSSILSQQVEAVRSSSGVGGFALFSYSYLFEPKKCAPAGDGIDLLEKEIKRETG